MIKSIILDGVETEYNLIRKNVKNINLRIDASGKITVSANKTVSINFIESVLRSKSNFIFNAINKVESKSKQPPRKIMAEKELINFINEFCQKVYPYYKNKISINFPAIKFKKMKTRWGSCCPSKEILTFNTNLVYSSIDCIEYVIHHEFTHFIHPNHSPLFYEELEKTCPDWKNLRQKLKKTHFPEP